MQRAGSGNGSHRQGMRQRLEQPREGERRELGKNEEVQRRWKQARMGREKGVRWQLYESMLESPWWPFRKWGGEMVSAWMLSSFGGLLLVWERDGWRTT